MIIQSDAVLANMTAVARRHARDGSSHLLCPSCRVRTKLYALKDGRRKCGACGKKFHPRKKTDAVRLRQYADILLCFALDFPAQQTSKVTGYRYRLVAAVYNRLRRLLAEQNLMPGKIQLLVTMESCNRGVHDSAFCQRCRSRFRCKGRKSGDSPVFGVKLLSNGQTFVEPLQDNEALQRFALTGEGMLTRTERFSGYAGFICSGKFHRFEGKPRVQDGAEQWWAWMRERLRRHHGIWKKNAGLYLKELEWKYNNRLLAPDVQALRITKLLPHDFLTAWKAA